MEVIMIDIGVVEINIFMRIVLVASRFLSYAMLLLRFCKLTAENTLKIFVVFFGYVLAQHGQNIHQKHLKHKRDLRWLFKTELQYKCGVPRPL